MYNSRKQQSCNDSDPARSCSNGLYPSIYFPSECSTHLELPANLHALLKPVGNSTLPGTSALSEGNGATEWTSSCAVAHAHDANIGSSGNGSITGHTSGHLNLHLEVGVGSEREALDTKAGHVLSDSGGLHSRLLGATRCAVDIGSEGTSTVLVDLLMIS